jgi:ubiquinone/menaquinone biosynthesis C-methylase UbiE
MGDETMKFSRLVKRTFSNFMNSSRQESLAKEDLLEKARMSGDPFKEAHYFRMAESDMDSQWKTIIWPMIKDLDFHCVLDLAAGHGRNTSKLRMVAEKIVVVDINQECIDYCRERFRGDERISFVRTDGVSLNGVDDESVTLIYSFDSMVHFEKEVVREYMKEFHRVLKPGGHGFCHHSNYTGNPGGDFTKSPHLRNYMSKELFAEYCIEEGHRVIDQKVIDWVLPDLDCLTLFQKPKGSGLNRLLPKLILL